LVLGECNGEVIVEPATPTEGPSRPPEAAGAAAEMQASTSAASGPADGIVAAAPQAGMPPAAGAPAPTPPAAAPPTDNGSALVQATLPYRSLPPGYDGPAPVEFRWEQLTAPRNRFESAERACQALAYVRQTALGMPVTRPDDFDPKAIVVRTFDWTRPDQAPSAAIAQALFRLPIAQPSDVIEDEAGWHLVLVHQRQPERNQPAGPNTVSGGGWSLDRQPQEYGTAYLDKKLFTEHPPTPGGTGTRPTRISRPDATGRDRPLPVTVDRPRRLPEPVALRSFPSAPEYVIDAAAETNADSQILRVNGILPMGASRRPPAE
jgi:hypothetical protein